MEPKGWCSHEEDSDTGVHPKTCTYFSGFSVVLKDGSDDKRSSLTLLFNHCSKNFLGGWVVQIHGYWCNCKRSSWDFTKHFRISVSLSVATKPDAYGLLLDAIG
jgi:hypothetical protein